MEQAQIVTVCRVIGHHRLTAQRVLLLHAAQYEPTVTEMAKELSSSLSATGSLVKTACHDGLVKRVHSEEDFRKVTIRLTPKGTRVLQKFFAKFQPVSA